MFDGYMAAVCAYGFTVLLSVYLWSARVCLLNCIVMETTAIHTVVSHEVFMGV